MRDSLARVTLKPKRDRSVRAGHPWVFSGAVAQSPTKITDGELVDVYSAEGAYLATAHYGTQGGIALRILSRRPIDDVEKFLTHSFQTAGEFRTRLGLSEGRATDAYRLINAEGDFLSGLVVDRYADSVVFQCHSTGMQRWREIIRQLSMSCFGVERIVDRSPDVLTSADELEHCTMISEHELSYEVSLSHGQKTGFFLDQRDNRFALRSLVAGKRVLNAYCYTGGFSVNAVAADARQVVSVDASQSACEAAKRTVQRNFPDYSEHEVLHADCKEYLPGLSPGSFEVIVLDPPAFVKHQNAKPKGLKGYEATIASGLRALTAHGFLMAFSCSQLITREEFLTAVARATERSERRVRIVRQLGAAPCHPQNAAHTEGEYLKGVLLYVE